MDVGGGGSIIAIIMAQSFSRARPKPPAMRRTLRA
jgi:hypothetical protein